MKKLFALITHHMRWFYLALSLNLCCLVAGYFSHAHSLFVVSGWIFIAMMVVLPVMLAANGVRLERYVMLVLLIFLVSYTLGHTLRFPLITIIGGIPFLGLIILVALASTCGLLYYITRIVYTLVTRAESGTRTTPDTDGEEGGR